MTATGQNQAGKNSMDNPRPYVDMSQDGFPSITPNWEHTLLDMRSVITHSCTKCSPPDFLCDEHIDVFGWALRMALANIPSRYWDLEIEDTLITDRKALDFVAKAIAKVDEVIKRGLGFTVVGGRGCGKTTLTIYFLKAALRAGRTGFFILMESLMTLIKDSFEDPIAKERFKKIKDTKVLVLDDLGKEYIPQGRAEFVIARLDELFRLRDSMSVSTLISSNLGEKGFKTRYGGGINSLLKNANRPLHLEGKDLREGQDGWNDICQT